MGILRSQRTLELTRRRELIPIHRDRRSLRNTLPPLASNDLLCVAVSNRPVAAKVFRAQLRHLSTAILNWMERHCSGAVDIEFHVCNEPIVTTLPVGQIVACVPNRPRRAAVR